MECDIFFILQTANEQEEEGQGETFDVIITKIKSADSADEEQGKISPFYVAPAFLLRDQRHLLRTWWLEGQPKASRGRFIVINDKN